MNRDYRDYPASIWDAIGDVDQGICCAALGGVVWDFMSHLTPAQLLAAMDSAALETLRAMLKSEELKTEHNGLQNLARLIVLEYGDNSEMTIDSREGEYFRVDIKLKNKERTTCTV